jgi:hypothetical protein
MQQLAGGAPKHALVGARGNVVAKPAGASPTGATAREAKRRLEAAA